MNLVKEGSNLFLRRYFQYGEAGCVACKMCFAAVAGACGMASAAVDVKMAAIGSELLARLLAAHEYGMRMIFERIADAGDSASP